MEIKNEFYLTGFTRIDKGSQGAVFVRYDDQSERKNKIRIDEAFLNYGGKNTENYNMSIPVRSVVAAAIVTRTSKNVYSATVFGERLIDTIKSETLNGLRCKVAAFFENESQKTAEKRVSGGF